MATTPAPVAFPSPRYLPAGWPLYLLFLGFPLWWVLGAGGLIWPVFAVPMLAWLLRQERVLAPRGFGVWLAFVFWVFASATQLDEPDRWIGFGYRGLLYLSATITLLYVFNMPRVVLPARTVAFLLSSFWIIVVVGGVLGVMFPTASFRSPVEMLMPQRLLSNDFVYELVHPAFAQVQTFLGYAVARPSAPFVYTNDWGANFGLLLPFVALSWQTTLRPGWRTLTVVVGIAAVIPVVYSLDRALWLSIGLALLYAAIRLALGGRARTLKALLVALPIASALVLLTPLRGLVEDRLETPHSNERRISLAGEATEGVLASPLFGFGAPRPSERNPEAPSVGTQGHLWLVFFSHGLVGGMLFLSWFLYSWWRTRRLLPATAFWCHVALLVMLLQLPFYGMLPAQLHIVMVGLAAAWREFTQPLTEERAPHPATVPVAVSHA